MLEKSSKQKMKRILIIEKDQNIRRYIKNLLQDNGYQVAKTSSASDALHIIEKNTPNLILMSWNVKGISGDSACWAFTRDYPEIPIILILEEQSVDSVVQKFKCGANDFVTKPLDNRQLLTRVKARLTAKQTVNNIFSVADLELDEEKIQVTRNGKEIQLTPQEFKLLKFLLQNKGRVLSRDIILERVWGYDSDVETRIVDVYVGYLRDKIDEGFEKQLIHTVRGFGYTLKE